MESTWLRVIMCQISVFGCGVFHSPFRGRACLGGPSEASQRKHKNLFGQKKELNKCQNKWTSTNSLHSFVEVAMRLRCIFVSQAATTLMTTKPPFSKLIKIAWGSCRVSSAAWVPPMHSRPIRLTSNQTNLDSMNIQTQPAPLRKSRLHCWSVGTLYIYQWNLSLHQSLESVHNGYVQILPFGQIFSPINGKL